MVVKVSKKKKQQRAAMFGPDFKPKDKPVSKCPNCEEELGRGEGHYFPPCFNEPGFFVCKRSQDQVGPSGG